MALIVQTKKFLVETEGKLWNYFALISNIQYYFNLPCFIFHYVQMKSQIQPMIMESDSVWASLNFFNSLWTLKLRTKSELFLQNLFSYSHSTNVL